MDGSPLHIMMSILNLITILEEVTESQLHDIYGKLSFDFITILEANESQLHDIIVKLRFDYN